MPNPGLYVLVANYYQPENAAFGLDLNITTVPEGAEAVDVEEQLASGDYFEAVLPLPTCMSGSGCRSVIEKAGEADKGSKGFQFNKLFHIQSRYIVGLDACQQTM